MLGHFYQHNNYVVFNYKLLLLLFIVCLWRRSTPTIPGYICIKVSGHLVHTTNGILFLKLDYDTLDLDTYSQICAQ